MKVTELGMVSCPVRPVQAENALFPMDVTELGMVSEPVKLPHSLRRYEGMCCTLFPITSSVALRLLKGELVKSSQLTALKTSLLKPLHPEKALSPMVVTELPMVSEPVKPLQPEKAYLPMEVTELGMVS